MRSLKLPALAVAAALVLGPGCTKEPPPPLGQRVIAEVNGEKILYSMLVQEIERIDRRQDNGGDPSMVRGEVLVKMIDRRLLRQEAARLRLSLTEGELEDEIGKIRESYPGTSFDEMLVQKLINFEEWKEDLRQEILIGKVIEEEVTSKIEIPEEEITAYYQEHEVDFLEGKKVRARQIVMESLEKAKEIKKALRGGADFAALAREHSIAPEAERGGDLGRVGQGTLPSDFEQAVFTLRPGRTSPIVHTQYGYHIFEVVERIDPRRIPFEEVRGRIEQELIRERTKTQYEAWLEELRASAQIAVHDALLDEQGALGTP